MTRHRLVTIAVPVILILVVAGVGLYMIGQQTRGILSGIDEAMIFDSQQAIIDEVAMSADCDHIRSRLAEAQGIIAEPSPDPLWIFAARKLKTVAEQQLDTMRCGG